MAIAYLYSEPDAHNARDLFGFSIDKIPYLFEKDGNGTVTAILDFDGEEVAKYVYDDCFVTEVLGPDGKGGWEEKSHDPAFIGNINKMRFFGYYYDEESGLYYCGRYYDAEREVFADGIGYAGQDNDYQGRIGQI